MSRLQNEVEHLIDHADWMNLEGLPLEAITMFSDVLESLSSEPANSLQSRALRGIGLAFRALGEINESGLAYQEALDVARECGDPVEEAESLNGVAIATQLSGRLELADAQYEEASRIARSEHLFHLTGIIEQNRGVIASDLGDVVMARERYDRALEAFETIVDVKGICWTLNNLGLLSAGTGHLGEAMEYFDQARDVASTGTDRALIVRVEINRANALMAAGEWALAHATLDAAVPVARSSNAPMLVAEALRSLAQVERESGRPWNGLRWIHQAIETAEAGSDALLLAESRREAGACWLALGDTTRARRSLQDASRRFSEIGANHDRDEVDKLLAQLA